MPHNVGNTVIDAVVPDTDLGPTWTRWTTLCGATQVGSRWAQVRV